MEYCARRGADTGAIGEHFGAACDQIDRANSMLARLRDQARRGCGFPERAWPDTEAPRPLALASRNPETQAVTLVLDTTTANAVIFAITAHADEREAHIREVERYGQSMPEGSYGRRNRQTIAARETRVATRLRAVEHAYRMAIERDTEHTRPEPTRPLRSPEHAPERQVDLEAEP